MNVENFPRIDIDAPRWDQKTYVGRFRYFLAVTNPLNVFKTNAQLDRAKDIVESYRKYDPFLNKKTTELRSVVRMGKPCPDITLDQLYKAKHLFDSAFHPDTGEKMIPIGRMAAQVPMNMLITGCMIVFYKSIYSIIFWQWFNQSFNAIVNYTNRSGKSTLSSERLVKSYVAATGGALITALSLKRLAKKSPPVVGRLIPFAAVAAANCINIPLMRYTELEEGLTVFDENGNVLGKSRNAAQSAIVAVIISRIFMCSFPMVSVPFLMEKLGEGQLIKKHPWLPIPVQILACGALLLVSTPMGCALFPQTYPVNVSRLEKDIQEKVNGLKPPSDVVYCNKGL